jgi:dethiobiotin synthetase
MSPHAAARIDGITIKLDDFVRPDSRKLIIEGAGGCMVPINDEQFIVDMILKFGIDVILVADLYLGSINHSILTIEALHRRRIKIKGIVFNGPSNPESEKIILSYGNLSRLLHIPREDVIDKSVVHKYAEIIRKNL